MTIAEYIVDTLAEYGQIGNDLLWIWYMHPTDASENKPIWLNDELLTRELETRGDGFTYFTRDLDIYIFTKDYVFIVCQYDGYFELQPVPNNMMIASKMTEYPCYGG